MDNVIVWLETWYAGQCDGDWEHAYGIRIDTIDNPGWRVAIDLSGTDLEDRPFDGSSEGSGPTNWIRCRVEDNVFKGYGGPVNLLDILSRFRAWAQSLAP